MAKEIRTSPRFPLKTLYVTWAQKSTALHLLFRALNRFENRKSLIGFRGLGFGVRRSGFGVWGLGFGVW
ncbi:MAG: hypothetical protein GXO88_07740, partial [Chlorobi bacterium]|nr:hypothetical protein [Chlorobiota bacterium]